jgi:hypothetical protein
MKGFVRDGILECIRREIETFVGRYSAMRAKPAGGAKNTGLKPEIPPPSAEEKKKFASEKRVKDAVVEQSLMKTGADLGTAIVDRTRRKETIDTLISQVQEDLDNSNEVVSQITQFHFTTQAEFELRMSRLKERISGLEAQLKEAEAELAELKREKHQVLKEKDYVIENQKREMKEMAYQFSDMLMKTLITITEDFEAQTSGLGRDETTLPQKERLKEFNLERIRV